MGTHPIFESDFDCLTEKMDDEFAAFMSEIASVEKPPAPPAEPEKPRKRGLPAAYRNRTGLFESQAAKSIRIDAEIEKIKPIAPDGALAGATISAAPVKNTALYSYNPADQSERKIGHEKLDITPFFGNEQQAFSMKKSNVEGKSISYQEIRSKDEVKHKHMSDRELKAKIEQQPTSAFSIGPPSKDEKKNKKKDEKSLVLSDFSSFFLFFFSSFDGGPIENALVGCCSIFAFNSRSDMCVCLTSSFERIS